MSTYWGYSCVSHDPPLNSDHWLNHGEDVLIDAYLRERRGEWPDDDADLPWVEPEPVVLRGFESTAPIWWLRSHPHCEVVLHNEYGETRPIREGAVGAVVGSTPAQTQRVPVHTQRLSASPTVPTRQAK